MKILNEVTHTYSICPICKDLMGPNAPIISMSYGYIEGEGLYVEETINLHSDCADTSILGLLLEKVESR